MNPRFPVYVISKGRWESRQTAKCFDKIDVPYHIVVEPQEYGKYAAVIKPSKIFVLPFSNLGQGSIPARNWCWEHSLTIGAQKHWIVDDNIGLFARLNQNLKVPVASGTIFKVMEDFADRYRDIALAGPHYWMFAPRKQKQPPFNYNRRIYSCILIRNDIPYRWRGRYNEDTDLSLRCLKDGWRTIIFHAFLALKRQTMTMKGGNSAELYKNDGRWKMAQSLQEQHPDVCTIVRKWGRWQHQVDYSRFRKNKLELKPGLILKDGIDEFGMVLRTISEAVSR